MRPSALRRIASRDSLKGAWDGLLSRSTPRSRKSSGIDDETIEDFARDPIGNCRRLASDMLSGDGYRFSHLRPHLVPKRDDKYRVICVPTVRDRIVQRAVSNYLATGDRCGLANDVSYGFIPGRSVKKAAQRACELRRDNPWAYKTDISSFFDSIPRDVLGNKIRRYVRDRSLHSILHAASECEIQAPNRSQAKRIKDAGIRTAVGVRQGMPLSPFFANLVLKKFDATVQEAGIRMVRYADDLICFADTEAACGAVHDVATRALEPEGLQVPKPGPGSKTQVYQPEESAEFLGLELRKEGGNYLLDVPEPQTQKIRQRIIEFATFENLERENINLGSFFRRIDGLIGGYSGAYDYANNAKHVEAVLKDARRVAVERLFVSELGIKVDELTPGKQRFLGLRSE